MSQKAMTALIFSLVALLAVVVVIGLVQKNLDTTGVAVALISVVGGFVGGAALRANAKSRETAGPPRDGDSS